MSDQDQTPAENSTATEGVPEEAIRRRAYEISQSAEAGSAEENWERARRELEAER